MRLAEAAPMMGMGVITSEPASLRTTNFYIVPDAYILFSNICHVSVILVEENNRSASLFFAR